MAIHHLVSRGLEAAQRHGSKDAWQKVHDIPAPALALVIATFFGYLLVHLSIYYTYGVLVPNLIMTEAPSSTTVIKTSEYRDDDGEADESPDAPLLTKEEKEIRKPRDEEVLVIVHKPVTAGLCSIRRHLREKTGSWLSRYRGAGAYLFYNLMVSVITSNCRILLGPFAPLLQVPLVAVMCVWSAAWVQQTVAMPGKTYLQRVFELRAAGAWKKLFMSFVFVGAVEYSALSLPHNIMLLSRVASDVHNGHEVAYSATGSALAAFVGLASLFFVVFPLNVALVRLQAALLSEETETVIPLDRSLGGAANVDLRAAWKSLPRGSVWRLVKTYLKVAVMQITVALVAVTVVAFELKVFAKPQFDGAVTTAREHYRI